MHYKQQFCNLLSRTIAVRAALAMAIVVALAAVPDVAQNAVPPTAREAVAPTGTFRVIHEFTGGQDGANPEAGLTIDRGGNLYGPGWGGGQNNCGNIYRLSRRDSNWIFSVLYSFEGGNDGVLPEGGLTIGPSGILYGTTALGGGQGCTDYGCGTVFAVRPAPNATANIIGGWTDRVLYGFTGGSDGSHPASDLVFDQAGNLYGAMSNGGAYGKGMVYELVPGLGGWAYRVVYSFTGAGDGAEPIDNIMFDQSGNLYGATYTGGGAGFGTVFELTPSGSGWTENTIYSFRGQDDSGDPLGLVMDQLGNLYGVTIGGGCLSGNCSYGVGTGGVFMLSRSAGGWTYSRIYDYPGYFNDTSLSIDAGGNLYGTLARGGDPCYCGEIYKLSPGSAGWTYTDLHDFNGSDGSWPLGRIVIDANSNIYGVTESGGAYGGGVVWEITP
jgi:uncharacterized repeat protein (TIGR03803 family)